MTTAPSSPRPIADPAWARATAMAGIAALASYALLLGLPAPLPAQVLLVFGFACGLWLGLDVVVPPGPRGTRDGGARSAA